MLLVWHPACIKLSDEMMLWLSVWSKVPMIYVWSSWCHCNSVISCWIKIQIGLTFWCRLTQVVLESRPLNFSATFVFLRHYLSWQMRNCSKMRWSLWCNTAVSLGWRLCTICYKCGRFCCWTWLLRVLYFERKAPVPSVNVITQYVHNQSDVTASTAVWQNWSNCWWKWIHRCQPVINCTAVTLNGRFMRMRVELFGSLAVVKMNRDI